MIESHFAEIKDIGDKLRAKTGGLSDVQRIFRELDPALDTLLKAQFNANASVLHNTTDPETGNTIKASETLQEQALANSNAPEDRDTLDEFGERISTGARDLSVIQTIIDRTPSLKGFSLDDAKLAVGGEENQMSLMVKYPEADPNIIMATAYTMLDNSREDLAQTNFLIENLGVDFSDLASVNILYSVEDDQTYKDWEFEKRSQIIDRISADPEAQAAIAGIRSHNSLSSKDEILSQYGAKERLADRVGEIFADIYGLETLSRDDINVVHKSLNEYAEDGVQAFAWSGEAGIENDELVVITHNPARGALLTDNAEADDSAARTSTMKTIIEELQHTTDLIYADKLANGDIDHTHPAFNHTTLTMLNVMNYSRDGIENYERQHVERTAKAVADDVSFEVMYRFNNPDENPKPDATQTDINADQTITDPQSTPVMNNLKM